jgi:hypothetical protein
MMGNGSIKLRGLFPELPVAVVVGREEAFPLSCSAVVAALATGSAVTVVSADIESSFQGSYPGISKFIKAMRSQEQQSTYNIQQNVRPQDRKKRLS